MRLRTPGGEGAAGGGPFLFVAEALRRDPVSKQADVPAILPDRVLASTVGLELEQVPIQRVL